jgi:GNAT superfamily N-acetyltransferase
VTGSVHVRPLAETDLDEAERIFRVAFGSFVGAPDPEHFGGDSDCVRTRWKADPAAAIAADIDGRLVGSNFATNWGSVGFFGPLTVAPEHWDYAIGQRLLDRTMELFTGWNTRHAGLFTFPHSAKHVGLYQKYGFWPRFLTAIFSRPVAVEPRPAHPGVVTLSDVPDGELPAALEALGELTGAIYPGLDVSREINAVMTQKLGETVLIDDAAGLQAMAVCHIGAGSEAGGGRCYIKFGAVRPGPGSARHFERLLGACCRLAASRGASAVEAGVNGGCDRAWAAMASQGFRPAMLGVAMHRPNDPGYHTSGSYVIDDWR